MSIISLNKFDLENENRNIYYNINIKLKTTFFFFLLANLFFPMHLSKDSSPISMNLKCIIILF